ncbi:MAG: glycosyltransferase [Ginsengibacter sp.]
MNLNKFSNLKAVQIHYSEKASGSAAWRLHCCFNEYGINSTAIFLIKGNHNEDNVKYLGRKANLIARIDQKIQGFINRKNKKELGLFSFPILGTDISKRKEIIESDFIYIHWTSMGFLNLKNIENLIKLQKPVIFILHDMWHITGGCHYSFDCNKYITGCQNCPILPTTKEHDLSSKEFKKKLKLYSRYHNIYFVSPSKWLYNCTKESLLTIKKPAFYIPNIINTNVFKPFNKQIAKNILNIAPNEFVLAFGAVQIGSPYKGWKYLQNALEILKEENLELSLTVLIFGSGFNKTIENLIPFKTKFLGHLNDEFSMVIAYNAADVFVIPSLADNQPTTVMESLSCGTPVVGFNTGGIPDMIKHKENGYLAQYKDSNGIATGIKFFCENKIKAEILPEFKKETVMLQHFNLINQIFAKVQGA